MCKGPLFLKTATKEEKIRICMLITEKCSAHLPIKINGYLLSAIIYTEKANGNLRSHILGLKIGEVQT
jgi:hypothetical protein